MNDDEQEDSVQGKAYDHRLFLRLLSYVHPYSRHIIVASLLILAASGLQLAGPYITKVAIDRYIASGDLAGVSLAAGVYLVVLLTQFLVAYGQTYLMHWIGQRIMFDLRLQLFTQVQKLDVAYFDRNPVGRLMTRLTSDVDGLNEIFTSGVVTIFGDVLMLLGIMAVMIGLNWKLALLTFSVIPFLFATSFLFRIKVRDSYRWVRNCVARLNAFLQENITGMHVVQLFTQEQRKFEQFMAINHEHRRANMQSIFHYALFYPLLSFIGAVAVALVIWYGGGRVVQGSLTLGALVAFLQYTDRFFRPISDMSEKYNVLQTAMTSAERIFGLLDTRPETVTVTRPTAPTDVHGPIVFEKVSFAYQNDNYVLRDVSFAVEEGEKLALVGATGAGKSTIINLLTRFYDVRQGRITLGGTDIRDYDLTVLRSALGLVLQDVFLFSGSVEENIRLGNPHISREKVRQAAELANAARFIERLPQGYATEVNERGCSLSAGEKQLLSFARALAYNPRILILDEATSNIDTDTELMIREALQRLWKGRTSIIIAHRLSTIQDVDRILVLHKGRIREMGSHQELLRLRGIYYRLYQLQWSRFRDQVSGVGGQAENWQPVGDQRSLIPDP